MRGKAEVRHERDQEPGITPACAGKRHCPRFRPGKTRDHPRVCGEKSSLMQMDVGPLGSPPRMRGKGELPKDTKDYFGITPAYAGKSAPFLILVTGNRDHPRVCGEKRKGCSTIPTLLGSPPRMRGKGADCPADRDPERITPAYAGKSRRCSPQTSDSWNHPRVCGEKSRCFMRWPTRRGSPPRMRGKGHPMHPGPAYTGITPAYAGKRHTHTHTQDHPRVCGEKS